MAHTYVSIPYRSLPNQVREVVESSSCRDELIIFFQENIKFNSKALRTAALYYFDKRKVAHDR